MNRNLREMTGYPEPGGHSRKSAESCRDKAQALIQSAIGKPAGNERSLLERSAAAWSMRAEQLQRSETRKAAGLAGSKAKIGSGKPL